MSEVADKILEAREKMNNRGKHWLRGAFRSKNPKTQEVSFCAVGACREVGNKRINPKLYHYLFLALPEDYRRISRWHYGQRQDVEKPTNGEKMNAIIRFNDSHKQTWGGVSKLFRKAARLAERDGA